VEDIFAETMKSENFKKQSTVSLAKSFMMTQQLEHRKQSGIGSVRLRKQLVPSSTKIIEEDFEDVA